MLSIEQVEQAKPEQWKDAAEAWDTCARLWETQADDYQKLVVHRLEHWTGPAAWAAALMISAVGAGFHGDGDRSSNNNEVATWMHKTADILRDFAGKITEAQEDLRAAQDEQPGTGPERGRGSVYAVSNTEAALQKATDADHDTAQKLRALLRGEDWTDTYVLTAGEAADLMKRAASGDKAALAELKQHRDQFTDPYFAKTFIQQVGPKGLTELPGMMADHMNQMFRGQEGGSWDQTTRSNKALLGMLSDALAAGTDPNGGAWDDDPQGLGRYLDQLKAEGRAVHETSVGTDYDGYWGLGQIMGEADGRPPYSTQFLGEVGTDMVSWDKSQVGTDGSPADSGPFDGPGSGLFNQPGTDPDKPGTGGDPLAGLMNAAATNAEGAQAILAHGDSDANLKYLVGERDWPADNANALGRTLEVAGAGQDETSKDIAKYTVDALGTRLADDPAASTELEKMQDSVGHLLADHIDEVHNSIADSSDSGDYSHKDLPEVMRFVTADDQGYKAVTDATLGHLSSQMDATVSQGAALGLSKDDIAADLGSVAEKAARTLGFVVEAHEHGLEGDALAEDRKNGLIADYAKKGIGLVTFPNPVAGAVGNEVAGQLIDHAIKTNNVDNALAQGAREDEHHKNLLTQMAQRAMVENPEIVPKERVRPGYAENAELFYDTEKGRLFPPEKIAQAEYEGITGREALHDYVTKTPGVKGVYNELLRAMGIGGYGGGEEAYRDRSKLNEDEE